MSIMSETIQNRIEEHVAAAKALESDAGTIERIADLIASSIEGGGKIMLCGNGGSAADAQHVAAEFVGRFEKERRAYPAIALTANSSAVTAIGNDYGFEHVFSRQVEAFAKKGDVLVGISTSGSSKNVLNAMRAAKKIGCTTIGVTGKKGDALRELSDISFSASSDVTAGIQEVHILFWHIVCTLIDERLTARE